MHYQDPYTFELSWRNFAHIWKEPAMSVTQCSLPGVDRASPPLNTPSKNRFIKQSSIMWHVKQFHNLVHTALHLSLCPVLSPCLYPISELTSRRRYSHWLKIDQSTSIILVHFSSLQPLSLGLGWYPTVMYSKYFAHSTQPFGSW